MKDKILVSVLVGTRNRLQPLLRCLRSVLSQNYAKVEVVVLDDCSEENICNLLDEQIIDTRLKCFRSEIHLGVAGGRNFLMQRAQGEVFVIIDDDAFFDNCESLTRIVNSFKENPSVGILAFKIINHLGIHRDLFVPFSKRWRRKKPDLTEQTQLVSCYVGTCHAIRRKALEQCGLYKRDLIYGGEEADMSYRAILADIGILYVHGIVVHHVPEASTMAQKTGKDESYYTVRNRIWFVYKYLPWRYLMPHLFIWLSFYAVNAIKEHELCEFTEGIWAGISKLKSLRRSSLDSRAVAYLKNHFGRLWY